MRKCIYILFVFLISSCVIQDEILKNNSTSFQNAHIDIHGPLNSNPYKNMNNKAFLLHVEHLLNSNENMLERNDLIIQAIWNSSKSPISKDYILELQRDSISNKYASFLLYMTFELADAFEVEIQDSLTDIIIDNYLYADNILVQYNALKAIRSILASGFSPNNSLYNIIEDVVNKSNDDKIKAQAFYILELIDNDRTVTKIINEFSISQIANSDDLGAHIIGVVANSDKEKAKQLIRDVFIIMRGI